MLILELSGIGAAGQSAPAAAHRRHRHLDRGSARRPARDLSRSQPGHHAARLQRALARATVGWRVGRARRGAPARRRPSAQPRRGPGSVRPGEIDLVVCRNVPSTSRGRRPARSSAVSTTSSQRAAICCSVTLNVVAGERRVHAGAMGDAFIYGGPLTYAPGPRGSRRSPPCTAGQHTASRVRPHAVHG